MRWLLLAVIFALGCAAPAPRLILTQSGSGDTLLGVSTKTTQTFHVNSEQWQIRTSCEALKTGSVVFAAAAFPKGKPISNDFVAMISQTSPGEDINYVHGSGDFYLSIMAVNIKTWKVEIWE
jgi:hypothetical protein